MAKNEAKIKFTAETGEFNSAINKANSNMTELRAELKLNRAQMETTGASVDGLQKEYSLLQSELKEAGKKTEALEQKLKVATKYFGENSNEVSKLKTQLANAKTQEEKIKQAINKCNNELKKHEDAFEDAGDAAEKAGKDAEQSSEGWTIVKDVIADMAKDAIAWAVESFKELMTAGEDALATLSAQTGATRLEMERYRDIMDDIYANNYGESFEDVADAMSVVVRTFDDLDDASLQDITEDAIALRDTFGYDYQESMRAVNSLMKKFGISSDKAFNLLVQGAQEGLDQNGDLLDVINEYSVQFADAGYEAEDMFNMLKNGAKKGTWSVDKLGDAVKEFNIRASDGTVIQALEDYQEQLGLSDKELKNLTKSLQTGGKDGQEAFKQILSALGGVKDETARYQAGVALFGTMWEDLGESTITALMDTQGEIKATKNAMEDLANVKYDTLSSAFSGLGRLIQSELIQPISNFFSSILKGAVEWMIENFDALKPIIAGVAAAFVVLAGSLAIVGLVKALRTAFQLLNATLAANPIILVVSALAGLAAAISTFASNEAQKFVDSAQSMAASVTPFNNAVDSAKSHTINFSKALSSSGHTMDELEQKISEAENGITEILGNAMSEQRALREDELIRLQNYNQRIRELEAEKMSIYRTSMEAEIAMLKNGQVVTQEDAAIKLATQREYLTQANEAARIAYENEFTQLQNKHKANGTLNSEAYFKELKAAQDHYTEQKEENEKFYTETTELLMSSAKEWVKIDAKWWDTAEKRARKSEQELAECLWNIDLDHSNAFLSMYYTTVKTGGKIDKETEKIARDMVGTFDGMPEDMNDQAHAALMGLIAGMEDEIPELKNASSMTAQEIVDVLNRKLEINSPSRVTRRIGSYITEGLGKGLTDKENWLRRETSSFVGRTISFFRDLFGVHSPSTETAWQGEMLVAGYVESLKAGRKDMEDAMQGLATAGMNAVDFDVNANGTIQGHVSGASERKAGAMNLQALAESINDLASRPIQLNINGRQFALATASDGDNVNGMRSTFKNRGLVLD